MHQYLAENYFGIPRLEAYTGEIPSVLLPFHCSSGWMKNRERMAAHFYIHEFRYRKFTDNPFIFEKELSRFPMRIAPDFSIWSNYPRAVQIYNTFFNFWIAKEWQKEGLQVIPSANFNDGGSYQYCFEGLPENSIISVPMNQRIVTEDDYHFLISGYQELVRLKNPKVLLIYGRLPLELVKSCDFVEYQTNGELMNKVFHSTSEIPVKTGDYYG